MREAIKLLLLGGDDVAVAPLTATTTTASETVTLNEVRVSAETEIDWGDGNTDTITGTQVNLAHTYASVGMYNITFDVPTNVTRLDIRGVLFSLNSAGIANMDNITLLLLRDITGVLQSYDLSDSLISLSASNISAVFNAAGLRGLNVLTGLSINYSSLTTAQCDAIIDEFWQQAIAGTRTVTGGAINISNNSPITGAVEPPPDGTPTTTGQKVYELVNDSGARGFNTWTTVAVDTA